MKPCIVCGEPSTETRCIEHRPDEEARLRALKTPHKRATDAAPGRWKRLSKRLRRMQPYCSACGSTHKLQVDHVVPIGERPEWAYEVANLDVLCQRCNQAKSNTMPSDEVVATIEAKITGGETPPEGLVSNRAKRQIPLHTVSMSGIVVNEAGEVR